MKISRRRAIQALAMSLPAAYVPRLLAQTETADPNAAAAGAIPGAAASAPTRPIPPAPKYIEPPAGFGVADGPFQPTWDSLIGAYHVPD
jgi:hypothetical protein